MNTSNKVPLYLKAAIIPVGILAIIGVLYILQGLIVPLIYATIIAIVLSPLVNFMVSKKINRLLAITITVILMIAAFITIIALLTSQLNKFSASFPKLIAKFDILFEQTEIWVSSNFNISRSNIDLWVKETNADLLNASRLLIGKTLVNIGNLLVILFLIPVYIFMILFYQPLIIEFIHKLFRANKLETLNEVLTVSKKIIQSYLIGLLLEVGIIAGLNSASLLLLGIDYAILLGVTGAILNIIPFLGGIIAATLSVVVTLATKSPSYAMIVLTSYLFIQFIDNHYVIPKVVASKVQINALVSIVVVLAGGALWGIPGMFLSIPITAILKVIFDRIESLKPWGFILGKVYSPTPKPLFIKTKKRP